MKIKHLLLLVDSLCVAQCVLVALFILYDGFQLPDLWILILSLTFAYLCASYFRTAIQLMQAQKDSQKLDLELNDLFRKAKEQKKHT